MERDRLLTFNPVNHPDLRVRRMGFDLSDTYVEQCWSAVVGPSTTLLLRRLPELWRAEVPAEIRASELSRSLGLGAGTGSNSRLASSLDRLVRFDLASGHGSAVDGLDVYLEVAPLRPRQLERVPAWTRATHERLLSAHLEGFDGFTEHRLKVTNALVDPDRFRTAATHDSPIVTGPQQGLGR